MKTVFNIVLGLCALVLVYICYASIIGPINFEKAKKHRDAAVIARLIDIRKSTVGISRFAQPAIYCQASIR